MKAALGLTIIPMKLTSLPYISIRFIIATHRMISSVILRRLRILQSVRFVPCTAAGLLAGDNNGEYFRLVVLGRLCFVFPYKKLMKIRKHGFSLLKSCSIILFLFCTNSGNCEEPYDDSCVDADPGDNVDVCYVDMANNPVSARVGGGYAIYEDDVEGDVHCHGFAWGNDSTANDALFKGNNLFYVSMYDHFYTRGYVRNIPGAPMCGCSEQMPVVDRSDCTELDANHKVRYFYDYESQAVYVEDKGVTIAFNACAGANDTNNDLEAYYEKLVEEGLADQAELEVLQTQLVGDCAAAIDAFLA